MVNFQIAIDCANPELLARFWAEALRYQLAPPPDGHASWDDYWRGMGVPEEELGGGVDIITDPDGAGPQIQFLIVPEGKTIKNRIHFDVRAGGGRSVPLAERARRIDAEAHRLVELGATKVRVLSQDGLDHYAVAMKDPEGNEFDVN